MKKSLLTLFLTVMVTAVVQAQQISVVSSGGNTTLYRTLAEAIEGASSGSVIYLPGGGFPISNEVKITKKLTIIGIGHKSNNDNVDGVTTISGNLYFNEGSSGSAVMGCYITGNVNIGDDDILIRCCNLNSVMMNNQACQGTEINQNYIRGDSNFNQAPTIIKNNVMPSFSWVNGGNISYNIICCIGQYPLLNINNSIITNNIFLNNTHHGNIVDSSNNTVSGNLVFRSMSEDNEVIDMTGIDPNDIFKKYNNGVVSPSSNFHFSQTYAQYESQVGIYAGDSFDDNQLAPVPYIVAKHVDPQTDASGKLNVKIRVKAGQ